MKRIILATAAAVAFSIGSMHAAGTCDGHGAAASGEKKSCCPTKKAENNETPTMSELKTVTKDELVTLIKTSDVAIFDARTEDQFAAGHVDGAVLFANATLPENKEATLVFYCGGTRCPAASKAARKALEAGYKNVLVFRGGWAEWSANG
jgi:rhodanese-related sulfurtransferase